MQSEQGANDRTAQPDTGQHVREHERQPRGHDHDVGSRLWSGALRHLQHDTADSGSPDAAMCLCDPVLVGGGHGRQDQHDLQPADDGQQRNVRFGRFHLLQNVRAIPEAQHTAYTDTRCGGYECGGYEAEAGTEKEESLTSS